MGKPKQDSRPDNTIISLSTNWPNYFRGFRRGFWEEISQVDEDANKTNTQRALESAK